MKLACFDIGSQRTIAEAALDLLPIGCGITLVDALDIIDEANQELECDDRESNADEDEGYSEIIYIREYCPCCGSLIETSETVLN